MPLTSDASVDTGIVDPADHDTTAEAVDPDVWAYAKEGDFATEWAVERTDETVVLVETHRRNGEETERDGEPTAFDVDPGSSTEEWAQQFADRSPAVKVEDARRYFD